MSIEDKKGLALTVGLTVAVIAGFWVIFALIRAIDRDEKKERQKKDTSQIATVRYRDGSRPIPVYEMRDEAAGVTCLAVGSFPPRIVSCERDRQPTR